MMHNYFPHFLIFVTNNICNQNFIFSWGEGSTSAMGSGVVDNCFHQKLNVSTTKPHGCMSQLGSGLCYNTTSNSIKKRSLKRAHNRLRLQGWTWYKGRIWTDPDHRTPSTTPVVSLTPPPPEHLPKRRLLMFCWNGGSLSSARYHELLHWLHLQRIDVAVISETHWSMDAEWTTQHWNVMHSGATLNYSADRSSGIMMLFSKRLCTGNQLAWSSIIPGRIVHCRLYLPQQTIDLIGLYQYQGLNTKPQMEKRETFWTSLDHLLQALPRRNLLSLLGDVNCTLQAVPRLVGLDAFLTSDGRKCGPQHSDRHRFVTILKDHDLVALNTWSEQHGPTYKGHFGRHSRIDYILTRLPDADTASKQVGQMVDAPFLPEGSTHVPLIAHLSYQRHRPSRQNNALFSKSLKTKCINDSREDTLTWQMPE